MRGVYVISHVLARPHRSRGPACERVTACVALAELGLDTDEVPDDDIARWLAGRA
jgi:hypothetical protein